MKNYLNNANMATKYVALFGAILFLAYYLPLVLAQSINKNTSINNEQDKDDVFKYIERRPEDNKTLYNLQPGNKLTAQQYLVLYATQLGLGKDDSLHLYKEDSTSRRWSDYDYSYGYQQYYKGVKVSEGTVRINMLQGEVAMVAGSVVRGLNIDVNDCITEDEALEIAFEDMRVHFNKNITKDYFRFKYAPPRINKIIYNNNTPQNSDPKAGYSLFYEVFFSVEKKRSSGSINRARTKSFLTFGRVT